MDPPAAWREARPRTETIELPHFTRYVGEEKRGTCPLPMHAVGPGAGTATRADSPIDFSAAQNINKCTRIRIIHSLPGGDKSDFLLRAYFLMVSSCASAAAG